MKLPSNRERADWASMALDDFADETGMEDEDRKTQITDLLCNLMHFCDIEKIDWNRCVALAQDHYTEEVAEERGIDLDENGE